MRYKNYYFLMCKYFPFKLFMQTWRLIMKTWNFFEIFDLKNFFESDVRHVEMVGMWILFNVIWAYLIYV